MAQYSFPILENDELLPCMEEMELAITAAQLAKPTADVVGPLFESVLISLTGVTREELNQPLFAAIDAFEYPELHDESIAARNFYRHLVKLMAACGVKDFGTKDIHKPEPARLRRHLSALINFAKFREEKLVAYSEMSAELDGLAAEQQRLQELLAAKEADKARMLAERAGQQEEASGVQAEVAELTAQNQALNKQFMALAGELKGLKAQCNGLADAAAAEKFELLAAKQENERLNDQIVQSPEKFQRSLAELTAAVESERGAVEEADRARSELAARQEMVGKVDKEVAKCIELMTELETAVATKKQHSRTAKELRESISGAQLDAGDLEQQQQHLRRQLATLSDRIKRLESQAAVRKEALESSIEEQLRDKEAVQAENAAQQALCLQHEAETRAVSERTAELKARHASAVAGLLARYGQLRGEVARYNAGLEAVMAAGKAGGAGAGGEPAGACAGGDDRAPGRDQ
ncbi:kpr-2 [Scenedesmus sp. PABB004]|nr:kpr-2 [Scenedesmus sp. PABB004]